MKFKQILSQRLTFGKNTYEADVPEDIINFARATGRNYVGVGKWLGTKQHFICFVDGRVPDFSKGVGIVYINEPALNQIKKLLGVHHKKKEKEKEKGGGGR